MKGKTRIAKRSSVSLTPFEAYYQSLSELNQGRLDRFFGDIRNHILLDKKEMRKFITDFEQAILYYVSAGLLLNTALERLSASNLGGFYNRSSMQWFALDDAAKIYPLSLRYGTMGAFSLAMLLVCVIVLGNEFFVEVKKRFHIK